MEVLFFSVEISNKLLIEIVSLRILLFAFALHDSEPKTLCLTVFVHYLFQKSLMGSRLSFTAWAFHSLLRTEPKFLSVLLAFIVHDLANSSGPPVSIALSKSPIFDDLAGS